jgi:tetratricopeptide (TPR) repeat protein
MLCHATRDLVKARGIYEAVALLDTEDPLVEARALGNLGAMNHDEGRFDDAYACYVEAIALFESLGDPKPIGIHLANLAMLDFDRGRIADAARRFGRAILHLETAEDPRLLAIAIGSLGMLELGEGRVAIALAHHQRAHALLQEAGDPRSWALCLGRLGAALACQGSLEEATAAMASGERVARRDGVARDTLRLFRAFLDLARAREALAEGRAAEAGAALEAARGRIQAASEGQGGERPLMDHSDDARAAHRVLSPLLERLESQAKQGKESHGSHVVP